MQTLQTIICLPHIQDVNLTDAINSYQTARHSDVQVSTWRHIKCSSATVAVTAADLGVTGLTRAIIWV